MEYASTVWSPHTATDIYKLEYNQRRAVRWATRDYRQTSSVTTMLGNLNWRTLDQRRIDSRLAIMYKVTYDLVAITAYAYLIPNRRDSKFIQPLAHKQIPTSTNYYRYSFSPRTIVHWNALPTCTVLLPTPPPPLVMVFARWGMYPPNHQILLLSFNCINTLFAQFKLIPHTLLIFNLNQPP